MKDDDKSQDKVRQEEEREEKPEDPGSNLNRSLDFYSGLSSLRYVSFSLSLSLSSLSLRLLDSLAEKRRELLLLLLHEVLFSCREVVFEK